jgi:enediyne biosynthesis protein E4
MWGYRSVRVLAPVALACFAADAARAQLDLTDVTSEAGVLFVHVPKALAIPGPQDWMPAGLAIADYDNDGWQDFYWASGGTHPDRLFMNNGDGTFTNEAAQWGVDAFHAACGACAGDYNDDGWVDIYVTSFGNANDNVGEVGKNRLYRNNGDGTFTDVALEAGVAFTGMTISSGYGCTFGDYDIDGDLDLCATAWYAPAKANRLFRNNGDGTFTDVTGVAVTFPPVTWGFQSRFADMDLDGWPELLVSADFKTSRYYKNNGDGTFADITATSGTGKDQNGMGQSLADFNHDGLLDWYVTSIFLDVQQPNAGEGNKLYINQGSHHFVESSVAAGVDDGGWGWGTVAIDLDNDSWVDIVEVNGRPGNAEFTGEQEYVWRNNGDGTFTEQALACGLTFQAEGKACSYVDYDRDGAMDVAITFNGNENRLYRNTGAAGNYIHLTFDTTNNVRLAPHGMHARVSVTIGGETIVGVVDSGPNFLGTSEICAHFGLASARVIDEIAIDWPRGYHSVLTNVAVNQHLEIESPALCDLDGNGTVDGADLGLFLSVWGPLGASSDRKADFDNNGDVDGADLGVLLTSWGGR